MVWFGICREVVFFCSSDGICLDPFVHAFGFGSTCVSLCRCLQLRRILPQLSCAALRCLKFCMFPLTYSGVIQSLPQKFPVTRNLFVVRCFEKLASSFYKMSRMLSAEQRVQRRRYELMSMSGCMSSSGLKERCARFACVPHLLQFRMFFSSPEEQQPAFLLVARRRHWSEGDSESIGFSIS